MNRVVISREEGRWLSRNILKTKSILESRSKRDPSILERKTYRTLVQLTRRAEEMEAALKAFGDEPYEFELNLERSHKTVLRELIETTFKELEDRILPEYKRRGLADYEEDTARKMELLRDMGRKLK